MKRSLPFSMLRKEIKLYAHHEKLARLLGTDIPMDVLMLIATKLQVCNPM